MRPRRGNSRLSCLCPQPSGSRRHSPWGFRHRPLDPLRPRPQNKTLPPPSPLDRRPDRCLDCFSHPSSLPCFPLRSSPPASGRRHRLDGSRLPHRISRSPPSPAHLARKTSLLARAVPLPWPRPLLRPHRRYLTGSTPPTGLCFCLWSGLAKLLWHPSAHFIDSIYENKNYPNPRSLVAIRPLVNCSTSCGRPFEIVFPYQYRLRPGIDHSSYY